MKVSFKKIIKYLIFGCFIGLLLIYLHFKRVDIKELVSKKNDSRIGRVSPD